MIQYIDMVMNSFNETYFPPHKDALFSSIHNAIATITNVMNEIFFSFANFIHTDFGRNMFVTLAIFGIIFFIIIATLLRSIVPRSEDHDLPHAPHQKFLARHEVGLTNVTLFFLGAGFFISFLLVVFYPGITSICLLVIYMVMMILRTSGMIGSYDSVFRSKSESLVGRGIRMIDFHTKEEVAINLISPISQARIETPYTGVFYLKVMTENGEVNTKQFHAHKGVVRRRFDL